MFTLFISSLESRSIAWPPVLSILLGQSTAPRVIQKMVSEAPFAGLPWFAFFVVRANNVSVIFNCMALN